jgi:hypothetical protein
MKTIRLIREITEPGRSGPRNGQWALQRLLRERGEPWLRIGGQLSADEIPWVWSWLDAPLLVACAARGEPFICGPNVLFHHSRAPCSKPHERVICASPACRLLFTESAWYRDLIREHLGRRNTAPVTLWNYPICPPPGGPLPAEYDLLIYAKSGWTADLIAGLVERWPRSAVLYYGHYCRSALYHAARRARACAYLSDDDRGPLALLEILLAGCPTAGIPRGAPFVTAGKTGQLCDHLGIEQLIPAVEYCHRLDRHRVAARAEVEYSAEGTVDTILRSLYAVATEEGGRG